MNSAAVCQQKALSGMAILKKKSGKYPSFTVSLAVIVEGYV